MTYAYCDGWGGGRLNRGHNNDIFHFITVFSHYDEESASISVPKRSAGMGRAARFGPGAPQTRMCYRIDIRSDVELRGLGRGSEVRAVYSLLSNYRGERGPHLADCLPSGHRPPACGHTVAGVSGGHMLEVRMWLTDNFKT